MNYTFLLNTSSTKISQKVLAASSNTDRAPKVTVSIGEAIDKLSILELKYKKITDPDKRVEIQKEIRVLSVCDVYKTTYAFYYHLLMFVNERIWDLTDNVKQMTYTHPDFAKISSDIFEYNQKRFRIKNWFNLHTSSEIKEQKSYASTHCRIVIHNERDVYDKIPEINYLLLEYDTVSFECDSETSATIHRLFNNPTIITNDGNPSPVITVDIATYTFESESSIRETFAFLPIHYIAGGLLGDFIQSLSVVCETFYNTGRKGILYVSQQKGDSFRLGIEHTYKDTYNVISSQQYIHQYKIHTNELYDIDLTVWRNVPNFYHTNENWVVRYSNMYKISWGKHPWIRVPVDNQWSDKVLINTTNYRFPVLDFKLLYQKYGSQLVFISSDKAQYTHFRTITELDIPYHAVTDFDELCCAISSCKLFVGSLSAPLAIAIALNVPCVVGLSGVWDDRLNVGFESIRDNIRYSV